MAHKKHSGSKKKSRSKKDSSEAEENAKKNEEEEEDDENPSDDDEEYENPKEVEVKSQEVAEQSKEKGVQVQYIPYSPQFLGPQQQQQRYQMGGQMGMPMMMNSPMGPGMGMTMAVPMQALIPVYAPIKGVLPGLEALFVSGGCFIKQELDLAEMFTGFEMNNRYSVFNSLGQRIYFAGEDTSCCTRFCFGHNRPFTVNVFNGVGKVVLNIEREQNYALCWCGGRVAGSHVKVTHVSTGEEIGTVRQNCNICNPSFEVISAKQQLLLNIRGPSCGSFCPCLMCCDVQFDLLDHQGNEVGQIMKTFQMLEMISDVTFFGVKYSEKLHVKLKALILAAVICIDFSYFEGSQGMRGSGGGGEKRSMNLSGCRCVWIWLGIAILAGLIVWNRIYYTNCTRDYSNNCV